MVLLFFVDLADVCGPAGFDQTRKQTRPEGLEEWFNLVTHRLKRFRTPESRCGEEQRFGVTAGVTSVGLRGQRLFLHFKTTLRNQQTTDRKQMSHDEEPGRSVTFGPLTAEFPDERPQVPEEQTGSADLHPVCLHHQLLRPKYFLGSEVRGRRKSQQKPLPVSIVTFL